MGKWACKTKSIRNTLNQGASRGRARGGFIALRFELFACRQRFICRDPLFGVMNCRCELKAALRAPKRHMFTSPIFSYSEPRTGFDPRTVHHARSRAAQVKQPIWTESIEQLSTSARNQMRAGQEVRLYAGNRCRDARGLPEPQHASGSPGRRAGGPAVNPFFGASTSRGSVSKNHSRPIIAYGMVSVDGPQQSGGRTKPQGRRSQSTKRLCDDGPCTTQKGRQSADSQALGQTERNRWRCSI